MNKLIIGRTASGSSLRGLVALALGGMLISGCGTTHNFLPGRPLAKKEWQIAVTWHYEFNRLSLPKRHISPDVSAYVGVGKNCNFGFGGELPFWVSHLSLSKYFESGKNDYWSVATHLNQPFGANDNPYLEFGGMYSGKVGGFRQNLFIGLAYGHGRPAPLPILIDASVRRAPFSYCLMPVVKYTAVGRDFGVSIMHYHGLTKAALSFWRNEFVEGNDTLTSFGSGELDSIVSLDPDHRKPGYGRGRPLWVIYRSSGDTVLIRSWRWLSDEFTSFDEDLQHWLGDEYTVYYLGNDRFIMNFDELLRKHKGDEPIVIMKYPQALVNKIDNTNSIQVDNSLGIAIISFEKTE